MTGPTCKEGGGDKCECWDVVLGWLGGGGWAQCCRLCVDLPDGLCATEPCSLALQ